MTSSILDNARIAGAQIHLPYAGAVSPADAFNLLQTDQSVVLVDVRTNAERDWVGRVSISTAQHHAVQWSVYPGGTPNADFIHQLAGLVPDKNVPILFLCRSGVRSRHAAKLATESGYTAAFDILEGFEGDKDENGHRKTISGWCVRGLPWDGG